MGLSLGVLWIKPLWTGFGLMYGVLVVTADSSMSRAVGKGRGGKKDETAGGGKLRKGELWG